MIPPALAITLALAALVAAGEGPPDTQPAAPRGRPAAAPERPAAEPLTLVGRGRELAVIENGELEQLGEAPPILILPESSGPRDEDRKAANDSPEAPRKQAAVSNDNDSDRYLRDALDARRQRLGRKRVDTPPPARGRTTRTFVQPRR